MWWTAVCLPQYKFTPSTSSSYLLYPQHIWWQRKRRLNVSEEINYCLTARGYQKLNTLSLIYSESCLVDSKTHQATTLLLGFLNYLSFKEVRGTYSSHHVTTLISPAWRPHHPPTHPSRVSYSAWISASTLGVFRKKHTWIPADDNLKPFILSGSFAGPFLSGLSPQQVNKFSWFSIMFT